MPLIHSRSTNRFGKLLYQHRQAVLLVLLSLGSLMSGFLVVHLGMKAGALMLGAVIGLPFIILCMIDLHLGFLLIFLISSFVFIAKRFVDAPFGLIPEILITAAFLGILLNRRNSRQHSLKTPVTFAIAIWIIYLFIQVLNPNATSLAGWFFGLRGILNLLFTYIILTYVFDHFEYVKRFTKLWLFIALLAALYGLYQEYAGLPGFDMAWVTSSEQLIGLNFIQGRWRKWSFLSDCTAFGMFMAISGIFCCILLMGPFSKRIKLLLAVSSALMFLSMSYSGTRTAYAMVPAGFIIYGLMTINKKRTIVAGASFLLIFLCIMFAPIHNPTINRIRTAFMPSEDASMNVREVNRARIQPYIYSHPFGGGLTTTGPDGVRFSGSHPLAGFPPDSGYLKVALETGWVGLVLTFVFYTTVIITGILNYFKAKDPYIRIFYAAYIAIFFSLTVANFAQASISQLPYGFVLCAIYVLMPKMIAFDNQHKKLT